jgi:RimJ/RimL family protein N-acetyltransferase
MRPVWDGRMTSSTGPVRLETARLVLEPASPALARAVLTGDGPPASTGWPGADALQAFRFAVEFGGDPGWVLLRDGVIVGECGTHGPPDVEGTVEIRYGVAPSVQRQGLGTEACSALAAWLLSRPGVRRVAASTSAAGNPASRRVLEKSGFRVDRIEGQMVWYLTERQI